MSYFWDDDIDESLYSRGVEGDVLERKPKRPQHTIRKACEFPDDEDLDWVINSIQRHTRGADVWLKQCIEEGMTCKDLCKIIIITWEAGRSEKE